MILEILDLVIFIALALPVLYLFTFALAAQAEPVKARSKDSKPKRIAVLIPAYREDAVIVQTVEVALSSDYPEELFDVVVIADRLHQTTIAKLKTHALTLIELPAKENSTKAKALNEAMVQLSDSYDIALVVDADNHLPRELLSQVASHPHLPLQVHRKAKNLDNSMALLDAASEEINNTIFRKGHTRAGFSAALIGSGMAFEYSEFKQIMAEIKAVGGFDKELELELIRRGKRIDYLENAYVLDEKVSERANFSRQRRRWLSAQFVYLRKYLPHLPRAVVRGRGDYADKIIQMAMPPRSLMMALLPLMTVCSLVLSQLSGYKWVALCVVFALTLLISVPRYLYSVRLLRALLQLPVSVVVMALNLFRLRGANKKFIHTTHHASTHAPYHAKPQSKTSKDSH